MDHLFGWLANNNPKKDHQPTDEQPDIIQNDNVNEDEHDDYDDDDDDDIDESELFPTHPGFTIPVEIKPTPHLGLGQYGVFAAADIPKHTQFWIWTDRVVAIPSSEVATYIHTHYAKDDIEGIQTFLRRGFVLPPPYDHVFYSNPTDAGTFMNHSSDSPNCIRPHGTARFIHKGEELTMDYSGNGNPLWYQDLCHFYGILTAVEIAQQEDARGGLIQPAIYDGPIQLSLLEQLIPF